MSHSRTNFRGILENYLELVLDPEKMDTWRNRGRNDLVSDPIEHQFEEIVNYFTDDLLDHGAFQKEFTQSEMAAMKRFVKRIREINMEDKNSFQEECKIMYSQLKEKRCQES